MRYTEIDKFRSEQLTKELKERTTQLGLWHSKRRKSDITRIWKQLFTDIENLLKDEKRLFTNEAFIILIVYPNKKRYLLQVHKHTSTMYHNVLGKEKIDYNKVILKLNILLNHYNLVLEENSNIKHNYPYRHLNDGKEYVLKFAKYN